MNHNQYLINYEKIMYAESQLTIKKKAHNLISQYQINDFCTLISFKEYFQKLHHLCRNLFKIKNACIYLHDTYK